MVEICPRKFQNWKQLESSEDGTINKAPLRCFFVVVLYESSKDGTFIKSPLRGREKTLPPNVTKKESHNAQTVAANVKIAKLVMAAAEKEDRLAGVG